ncbi:hypothetical protein PAMA_014220 [Pampus argenteus]
MMLKMVAVALLLLCFGLASADSKKCDISATEGQTIAVPLNYKVTSIFKWIHNDKTVFRRTTARIIHGDANDIFQNGSLKLINLDKKKSGKYSVEVYDGSGEKAFSETINVCLLDKVPNPEMTIKCSVTHVTFSCKVDKVEGLQFAWIKNGLVIKDKNSTLKLKAEDVKDDFFQCKVSNAASSQTTKAVKHTCISSKLFGLDFWFMVGILAGGGGLVVLLIIIIIACCIRARRKNHMKFKDEEELRLDWTKSERDHHHQHQHNHPSGQHHPHPHPHHQCQPAGHTGPRHHRSKNQSAPHSKLSAPPKSRPQPSPRRAAQRPAPVATTDDEQPPPLPQPRKKVHGAPSV